MRRSSLLVLLLVAACQGGGAVGDRCGESSDCTSGLQCVANVCVPHCQRAPECGDGYTCTKEGLCRASTGQAGDQCTSESDCAAGLACELVSDTPDDQGHLLASCTGESSGRPPGDECTADADCREGLCALGHCVDLCRDTLDCAAGTACTQIPRVEAGGALFAGCLLAHGTLQWQLPIDAPAKPLLLPSPSSARQLAVTFDVEDPAELVGATHIVSPSGVPLLSLTPPDFDPYPWPVRHTPELAQSVLVLPSSPSAPLETGAYAMTVTSLRESGLPGTATPRATVVAKLDQSVLLDLHFYFLNFDDHPCTTPFGELDATSVQAQPFFQNDYLGALRSIFAHGGVSLGTVTYDDLRTHPDLDGLDITDAPSLLALGAYTTGINVFFVRTLRPVGLQAYGPNPGPAGLAGTRQSGIVVSLDTLCYRSWSDVARLTAHELARYMGLYDNIDLSGNLDPIDDSDASSENLMYFSDSSGTDLSPGQRDILSRSAVLR